MTDIDIPIIPELPWLASKTNLIVKCNIKLLNHFIAIELNKLQDIKYNLIKNKYKIEFYINNSCVYITIDILKLNNTELLLDIICMNGDRFIFIKWFKAFKYNFYINNFLSSNNDNCSKEMCLYPKNKIYNKVSNDYIKSLIEKFNLELKYYEEILFYLIIIANLISNKQNAIIFKKNNFDNIITLKTKKFLKMKKINRLVNKITLNLKGV